MCTWEAGDLLKTWHLTRVLKDPGPSGHLRQGPPTLFSRPSPTAPFEVENSPHPDL